MEEKNNQKSQKMSNEDLAQIVEKGFEESAKQTDKKFIEFSKRMDEGFEESARLIDKKIEKLAIQVQNEFLELGGKIKEVKSDTEEIKTELNKKVSIIKHNDLIYRVEKLEKKFA